MYGTRSQAEGFEILAKAIIVESIASHRKMISIKAAPGDCRLKKIIDQNVFKTSCPIKISRAILTSFRSKPFFHTRNAAIPMRAKRVVQTGPNTQFGGASSGLASVLYQSAIEEVVNIAPVMPASSEIAMATMSLSVLFMVVVDLF